MSDLTQKLTAAYENRLTTAAFDPIQALEEVLGDVGLSSSDAGGTVTCAGADPVVRSPLRIGGAATIGLLAKSVAAAAMHRWRGGEGQDIAVDLRQAPHRLSPFYDGKWERIGRYPILPTLEVGNVMGALFFRTADNRWVMPQAMYAGLRVRAQELLGVPLIFGPVTEAIGKWDAFELEEAAARDDCGTAIYRCLGADAAYRDYPHR